MTSILAVPAPDGEVGGNSPSRLSVQGDGEWEEEKL